VPGEIVFFVFVSFVLIGPAVPMSAIGRIGGNRSPNQSPKNAAYQAHTEPGSSRSVGGHNGSDDESDGSPDHNMTSAGNRRGGIGLAGPGSWAAGGMRRSGDTFWGLNRLVATGVGLGILATSLRDRRRCVIFRLFLICLGQCVRDEHEWNDQNGGHAEGFHEGRVAGAKVWRLSA
jgi:hypothetical protein